MRAAVLALLATLVAVAPAAAQAPPPPTPTPTATPVPTFTPVPTATPVPPPEPTVPPGVTVARVDLSGQTLTEVRATLRTTVRARLRKPVVLRRDGERRTLGVGRVKQHFNVARTARRALRAAPGTAMRPTVRFRRAPIRKFVERFARDVAVAPRDAGVRITIHRIYRTKAAIGRRLAVKRITKRVERLLDTARKPRTIRPKLVRVRPAVGAKDLKRAYPSIITIDQSTFTLRLFRGLRYDRSYSVAVGQSAYPTPNGLFAIQSKQVNPTWTAPSSPWAGEAAGQSYDSSDPNNPLKARWMGVTGSVGLHGTAQEYSIGTRASHGCIRMRVSDVIALYDRVGVGTPVLIAP